MTKRQTNFRARNLATGKICGHSHHTREKALGCIEHMGWDPSDCVVEAYSPRSERKSSMHHRPLINRRGTREAEWREQYQPKSITFNINFL